MYLKLSQTVIVAFGCYFNGGKNNKNKQT
uniref:Lipoprotein n=1 Tax=Anguilla anguilla TaxID=7936 RepID=A0A0E9WG62_ANGAN